MIFIKIFYYIGFDNQLILLFNRLIDAILLWNEGDPLSFAAPPDSSFAAENALSKSPARTGPPAQAHSEPSGDGIT